MINKQDDERPVFSETHHIVSNVLAGIITALIVLTAICQLLILRGR